MHFLFTEYRKHLACDSLQAGSLGYFRVPQASCLRLLIRIPPSWKLGLLWLLQSTASILLAIPSKLEAWVTLSVFHNPDFLFRQTVQLIHHPVYGFIGGVDCRFQLPGFFRFLHKILFPFGLLR